MPGSPDFATAGGLSRSAVAISETNVLLAPQGIQAFTGNFVRTGYEFKLVLAAQTTGSQPAPFRIVVVWLDTASSTVVEKQTWWVYAGDQTGAHTIYGKGPSAANEMEIQFENWLAAAPSVFVTLEVLDVARNYLSHDWQTDDTTGVVFPGMTGALSDLTTGIIGTTGGLSVPAGSSATRVLPLYAGSAYYLFETGSATVKSELEVRPNADQGIGVTFDVIDITALNGSPVQGQLWMPRAQCQVVFTNPGTVAHTINYTLGVSEFRG